MNAIEKMSRELTKEEALALIETKWWKKMPLTEAAYLQLKQDRLCLPWNEFNIGLKELLGRPVWTHEFANVKGLIDEADGKRKAPNNPIESLLEIIGEENAHKIIPIVVKDKP